MRIFQLLERDDDLIKDLLPIPWSEALRRGRHHKEVGEISRVDDIAQLLVDVSERAVGLVVADETTIRWLDLMKVQREAVLPGVTHDFFLGLEDQSHETRRGWLVRTGEGVVVVN